MNSYTNFCCQVKNCRYPNCHVTKNHKCGKCNKLGHGFNECGNQEAIQKLMIYWNDTLPDDCRTSI